MTTSNSPFFSNETSSTNTMACPACRQIIMADVTSCRHCGVPIDARTAAAANAAQQRLNSAISQANAIKLTGWAAAIVVVAMVLGGVGYLSDRRTVILWFGPPLAVAGVAVWFRRFGRLPTQDPDYETAKRDVRRAGYIWAVALLVEVGLLLWVVAM